MFSRDSPNLSQSGYLIQVYIKMGCHPYGSIMDVSWNVPELPQGLSLIQSLILSTPLHSFVPSTLNLHNI